MKKRKKIVLLLIDGLADEVVNKKTPLREAYKPNFDFLAANGLTGQLNLIPKTQPPETHIAVASLLGCSPSRYYLKRGPIEAVGAGIPLEGDFLALRANFATIDESGKVIDRRAGKDAYGLSEIARSINKEVDIGIKFIFLRSSAHRAVLVLKEKLSDKIEGNDPLKIGKLPKEIKPLEKTPLASLTARILQNFVEKSHEIMQYHQVNYERISKGLLPVNYILLRGAGNKLPRLPNFVKKWKIGKSIFVGEVGAAKGIAMLSGFDSLVYMSRGSRDINYVFERISDLLPEYDFIFAYIKSVDEASHEGNFEKKKKLIEEIDSRLEDFKNFDGILIITSDHITSSKKREHLHGPVPLLVYGLKKKDKVKSFDEMAVRKGKLKNFTPSKLWRLVLGG